MYKVQSVLFNKSKFSLYLCKQWLKEHQYKDKDLKDETNFYHFRQYNPTSLKKQGYTEFRTKKLGKSGIELIIAYKPSKSGGKISNDELHHFIHSSYTQGESYKGWKLDSSLSDASVQVYFNGKDAVVVHRGSQDAQDWYENGRLILGMNTGKRLEHSRNIQKLAEEKYGANNVITIGHSKGAHHAEEVGQNSREIYTLNKPVTPSDLIKGKKVSEKQTDIRTTLDPVSILRPLQQGSDYQNIWSKTLNPLTEHMGSVLNRVNPAKWWGKGRCWKGYEPVPGMKPYSKGSCRKISGNSIDMKTGKKAVLKNYQQFLNHLTSHIGDPNEPIDPRDFKQSKQIINAIRQVKSGSGTGASVPTRAQELDDPRIGQQRNFDDNARFINLFFNSPGIISTTPRLNSTSLKAIIRRLVLMINAIEYSSEEIAHAERNPDDYRRTIIPTDENIRTIFDCLTKVLEVAGIPEADEAILLSLWSHMTHFHQSPFLVVKKPVKSKVRPVKGREFEETEPLVIKSVNKRDEFDNADWFLGELVELRRFIRESTHWNEHQYDVLEERIRSLMEYIQANATEPDFENQAHAFIRFCRENILNNTHMTNTILRLVQPMVEHLQTQFPEVIHALSGRGREFGLSCC